MSCLTTLKIVALFLCFSGLVAPAALEVTVSLNGTAVLPCSYTGKSTTICWGRGACPTSWCDNEIIWADGKSVPWRKSDRYQLLGAISQGDVSLTITGVTKEDEGTYCCKVEIPGPFNNLRKEVGVKIREGVRAITTDRSTILSSTITDSSTTEVTVVTETLDVGGQKTASIGNIIRGILIFLLPPLFLLIFKWSSFSPRRMSSFFIAEVLLMTAFGSRRDSNFESFSTAMEVTSGGVVTGSVNGSLTLPCAHQNPICWGRGRCSSLSLSKCNNGIIGTDDQTVTWWKSDRYQLLGDLSQGNVSLSITRATKEDKGTYCCLTKIDSIFGKVYGKEVEVQITDDPEVREFPTIRSMTIQPTIPKKTDDSSTTEVMVVTNSLDVRGQKTASIGNIIRGILIFLLPPLFLLIYKWSSFSTRMMSSFFIAEVLLTTAFASRLASDPESFSTDPEVRDLPTIRSKTIQPTIPKTTTDSSTTEVMVVRNTLDVGGLKTASIGNIIRGILIFLLPPLFLLIYKCCSL
ncbi:uncharacterized protein [Phyllobates terribilis]|uniref:uncharacterized protein n=1 Tax=Phyllobates terribilis TaxID=111132 RepID=UPI003CCB48BF